MRYLNGSMTTVSRRAAVGVRLGAAGLVSRIEALADDGEHGAQVAEYAMLGGVSAAACTGLVTIFKNKETLKTLVDAVVGTLGNVIEGWF